MVIVGALIALCFSWLATTLILLPAMQRRGQVYAYHIDQRAFHLITAIVAIIMLATTVGDRLLVTFVMLLVPVVVLSSIVDLLAHLLPLRLTVIMAITVGLYMVVAMFYHFSLGLMVGALITGAIIFVLFFMIFFATPHIGFGDVLLAPVMYAFAATQGLATLGVALVATAVIGGVEGLVARKGRELSPVMIAYGPAIMGGTFLAIAVMSI